MLKKKGSLVVSLLAAMVICTTAGAVPVEAKITGVPPSSEARDIKYSGKITGEYHWIGNTSLEQQKKDTLKSVVLNHKYNDSEEDYMRQCCTEFGLDFDALVAQRDASSITSEKVETTAVSIEYPQMNFSWQKNKQGQWFYSANGTSWYNSGWAQIGGKWYFFYDTGVMAANTTIDGYTIGADGTWSR